MKFSYRRTPLQAFGWYFTFLFISIVLRVAVGFVAGIVAYIAGISVADVLPGTIAVTRVTVVLYHVVLGILLLRNRPKSLSNILLVVGGIGLVGGISLSPVNGAVAGLIPLAVLTTRPSSTLPEVAKVFE
jgi:hypothetical protein